MFVSLTFFTIFFNKILLVTSPRTINELRVSHDFKLSIMLKNCMGEEKTYTEFMWRNPMEKEYLEVLDIDGRTISKQDFKLDGKT